MMKRIPEPEVMDDAAEVQAYKEADFRRVNRNFAHRVLRVASAAGKTKRTRVHVLDLGTGPADIPILLSDLAPTWRVTAVDASVAMLREARRNVRQHNLTSRIRVLKGNATELRRVSGPFDVIISNSLLHHLENPVPLWCEIRRLLKPRGAVVLQDLARPSTRQAARKLVRHHADGESRLLKQLFYQSLLAAFTPEEVRNQIAAAELRRLSVRRLGDRHLCVHGCPGGAR